MAIGRSGKDFLSFASDDRTIPHNDLIEVPTKIDSMDSRSRRRSITAIQRLSINRFDSNHMSPFRLFVATIA